MSALWTSIVLLCTTTSVSAQLCFEGNPTVTVPSAESLLCGDLDGDLRADLVVGISTGLRVYLSTPQGTFNPHNQFLPGRFAYACADLDSDGDLDLLTNIQFVTAGLVPYMNQGNGVFAAGASIPLASVPRAVHCADFDGDGDVDLATASLPGSSLSVVFNLGNGTYSPQVFYSVSGDTINGADLDGDGDQDLVMSTSYNGPVYIFLNSGAGVFLPPITIVHPGPARSLACHDYDNDGDLDVVTQRAWISNLGSGVFAAYTPFVAGPNPTWVTTGDFDGDQLVDMAAVNQSFANVTVSLNQGGGAYATSAGYIVGSLPALARSGDVDGDGDEDIVSLNQSGTVTLLENRGDGSFDAYPHYPASNSVLSHFVSITSADFDGDGDVDVATSIWNSSLISVLLNQGDGTFGAFTFHGVGLNPWNLTHADLDGDGDEDLVVTNSSASSVSVLFGLGNGTFAPQVVYPVGIRPVDVSAADVDLDGDLDLFTANSQAGTVSLLINQGAGVFGPPIAMTSGGYPTGVACADLDGDGDVDCVTANTTVNTLSYFQNLGSGTFAVPFPIPTGVRPTFVAASDLDGDGDQDLAVTNNSTSTVSVLVNQGGGVFAPHVQYPVGWGPAFITASDMDADGDVDLVTTNGSSNVWVLLNQGNATFSANVEYGAGFDPRSVAVADYDGDGRKDMAVVAYNTDFVTVLLQCPSPPVGFCFGDGSGTSCPCATVGSVGHGCPNSTFASGARLDATGLSRSSNDSLRLVMGATSNSPGLFIQGTNASSVPFGDGLLCIGGGVVRLAVVFPSASGVTLPNASNPTPLHVLGGIPPAGGTHHYQAWYRDADPAYCTSATFNLTNGVTAVWAP